MTAATTAPERLSRGPRMSGASWRTYWLRVLVSVLGVCEAVMATSAGSVALVIVGFVCGLAVAVAPWLPAWVGRWALVPLVVAAVLFAALTWWTVVTPVLAVIALSIGVPLILRRSATPSPRVLDLRAR